MATMSVKTLKAQSLDRNSTISDAKRISAGSGDSKKKICDNRPTPLNFDFFLPWICLEMQVPILVVVTKIHRDKTPGRRSSSSKPKSITSLRKKSGELDSAGKILSASSTDGTRSSEPEPTIPVTTYYDAQGQLVEIAIIGCTTDVPRKVIQAINLCLPFHALLTKLEIRKGGVNSALLYEIGKMLPHSHLTDVCLDDTSVPECNYHVLLNNASSMKYLSLSRCNVTDYVSNEIFSCISYGCPAAKSLMILNLSSNFITDTGAKFIGDMLRRNRHLLHLNLSGNRITDVGFYCIVKHLTEFPLTYDEVLGKRRRYLEYSKNKLDVYKKCMEEISLMSKSDVVSTTLLDHRRPSSANKNQKNRKSKKIPPFDELSAANVAERMTKEVVGEFCDIFDDDNIVKRDDYFYSVGNLKFCSLNVSYNRLEFPSLLRILDVLRYQSMIEIKLPNTGLLRFVVEGNFMPQCCPELGRIEKFLSHAVNAQKPVTKSAPSAKKRQTNALAKHR